MRPNSIPTIRPRRTTIVIGVLGAALVGVGALTGCGAGPHGGQSLAVGVTTTTPSAPRTASTPSTTPPSSATSSSTTASTASGSSPTTATTAVSSPTCIPATLRAQQSPVSSGTGTFYLAWSLTNTGATSCSLPAGQPTLAFLDAAGTSIVAYAVFHLPTAAAAAVELAPGAAGWFLTEETTTTCGAGKTIGDGPFHYQIGLPGGTGSLSWTASYLSAPTLHDFCAAVALGVGDIRATEPTAP